MYFHSSKSDRGYRCWWYPFGCEGKTKQVSFSSEFYPFTKTCGVELALNADSDSTVAFNIKIPYMFSWYVSMNSLVGYRNWWGKMLGLSGWRKHDGRRFGISWYSGDGCMSGGSLDIKLGAFDNGWESSDPKWLSMSFYPEKFLFGNYTAKDKEIETTYRTVFFKGVRGYPDKNHILKCVLTEMTWTWKRFRKPFTMARYEVSSEEGIPHPGKGTCDYNCDETALYSQSSSAKNAKDAIDRFVQAVYKYRTTYPL